MKKRTKSQGKSTCCVICIFYIVFNLIYFRPMKCAASKLYDFCWCLFLCAKNEGSNCTLDLVSSLHLLLCCIDLIYVNALTENRVELINPNFEGVPKKWNTPEFNASNAHKHCIIEPLCKFTEGLDAEARSMKHNLWKKIVTEFIETKVSKSKISDNIFLRFVMF